MLIYEGKFSFWCFSICASIIFPLFLEAVCTSCSRFMNMVHNVWWLIPIYFLIINLFLLLTCGGFIYKVAVRSAFLGTVFAAGIYLVSYGPKIWGKFGLYLSIISFFHYSEFLTIAWCNPSTLSIDSFMLNHSTEYCAAAVASWIEFIIETSYYPDMKRFTFFSMLGFSMCVIGELLRKAAMFTAKTNFNHIVQLEKHVGHELVTHGVYALCRHPSYVGWFYWSIGTQLLLLNPVCLVLYTLVSWNFFKLRIESEEQILVCFFGEQYTYYQKIVGTGLPGIHGFIVGKNS